MMKPAIALAYCILGPRRENACRLALAMLGLLALAGCAAAAPSAPATPQQKAVIRKFNLSKCQQLETGLFQCPESDKPLCDPSFMRNDVICIRVSKSGELMMQQ